MFVEARPDHRVQIKHHPLDYLIGGFSVSSSDTRAEQHKLVPALYVISGTARLSVELGMIAARASMLYWLGSFPKACRFR